MSSNKTNILLNTDEINLDLDNYFIGITSNNNDKDDIINMNKEDILMIKLIYFLLNNNFDNFKKIINNNKKIINKMSIKGMYLLHFACYKKKHDFVTYLLYMKADPYKHDAIGKTSQHYAVLSGDSNILNILILYGIRFDIKDIDGNTPLHYAISHEDENIVDILLDNNIDPFIKNNKNLTPVEYSITNKNIMKKIKKYICIYIKNI